MNSPMAGTSIQELRRNESMEQFSDIGRLNDLQQMQYAAKSNNLYEQAHNANHNVAKSQHQQYYNMENNFDYPQWLPRPPQEIPPMGSNQVNSMQQVAPSIPEETLSEEPDIEDLAIDISNSLPVDEFPSVVSEVPEEAATSDGGYLSMVPEMLREPLIIFVLFMILSENVVKDTISRYVQQIAPDMTGRVSRTGVIIYGVLLATLFVVVKKLVL